MLGTNITTQEEKGRNVLRLENEEGYVLANILLEEKRVLYLQMFAFSFPKVGKEAKKNKDYNSSVEYAKREIKLLMGCFQKDGVDDTFWKERLLTYDKVIVVNVCGVPIIVTQDDNDEKAFDKLWKEWNRLHNLGIGD